MSLDDRIQKVTDKFDQLHELSERYSDYQRLPNSKIVYRDIENPEHLKKAKKITSKYNLFIIVIALVFGLTTVASFFSDTDLFIKLLLCAITVFLVALVCKSMFSKPKIAYGIAIYKDRTFYGGSARLGRPERYMYYITFVPDGEKVLYTRIKVSMEDYNQIQEGTRVMVVNKGPKACIL